MELPSFYKSFFGSNPFGAKPPNIRVLRKLVISALTFHGLLTLACTAHAQTYSVVDLKRDVAKFLTNEYSSKGRVQINVGNLDQRLRLYTCPQIPLMQLRDASGTGGNINVQVQCKVTPGWSVHVPAQVSIFRELPVAIRDLNRGEQVTPADISWESMDISELRQSYHTEAEAIIGREVKRNVGQGLPFLTASLDAPTLVRRGDQVDLQSQAGSIVVSTNGTAMTDGRLGQKIRIRNNQSDRIVTGTVVASGKVSTF